MSTRLFAHQLEETAETLEYIWGTFRGKKFLINTALIVTLIGFRHKIWVNYYSICEICLLKVMEIVC